MQKLFKKYLENECSPDEVRLLLKEFGIDGNEEFLKNLIQQQLEIDQPVSADKNCEWEVVLNQTYTNIKEEIGAEKKPGRGLVVSLIGRRWWYAAAAILLIGSMAVYRFVFNKQTASDITKTNIEKPIIVPGGNKAILTLADGTTVILDSAANGNIASQGNTKLIKVDGQLAYNTSGKSNEILYNTVSTPRGGLYNLILADGSKVWLNAASSLRFPATFIGKERKVELTGEAYFEVAKNAAMPFKVEVNGMNVEVLGTHFNINSYADEATINTTLLEGKVKVTSVLNSQLLSPGQQAQLNANGQISLNKKVDVDEVMSWKNSLFSFNTIDITGIMRQISRWYDVDVSYQGKISTETFSGMVSRNSNISQVLKIMEQTGVRFKIEGKKIVQMQ
jgi:ferric-dicitrate binding protein FerR (iron transport regulator)